MVFFLPAAVSCGVPIAPVNGGVLAADYSVGTRVTYFCNSGYRLSSKELTTTVCQPDGTWSNHNKIPRCIGEWRMLKGGCEGMQMGKKGFSKDEVTTRTHGMIQPREFER